MEEREALGVHCSGEQLHPGAPLQGSILAGSDGTEKAQTPCPAIPLPLCHGTKKAITASAEVTGHWSGPTAPARGSAAQREALNPTKVSLQGKQ